MKHLVLAIGIFAVSVWRAIANLVDQRSALSAAPAAVARPSDAAHPRRPRRRRDGHGVPVLLGHRPGAARPGDRADLHRAADRAAARRRRSSTSRSAARSIVGFARRLRRRRRHRARPGAAPSSAPDVLLGTAAIIGSALCYAVNIVLMRHQALAAKPLEINFFQSLTVHGRCGSPRCPFVGVPAWPAGQWPLDRRRLRCCRPAAPCCSPGPMRAAKRAISRSPNIARFLWASALGWLVFHERVSLYTLAGAVLIVGGCLVAARGKIAAPPEIDVAA